MNFLKYIVFLAASVTAVTSDAQELLGIDGEEATSIGVYIKDLTSNEVLYDFNSELALTPASVMKSVTSATVLSLIGEDYRFTTPVVLRGNAGSASTWRVRISNQISDSVTPSVPRFSAWASVRSRERLSLRRH